MIRRRYTFCKRKEYLWGGRAALEELSGHLYETGAGIIHTSNKYLDSFTREFGKPYMFMYYITV